MLEPMVTHGKVIIIGGTHGIGRTLAQHLKGFPCVIGRTAPDERPFPTPEWLAADLLDHDSLTRALDMVRGPVTGIVLAQRYRGSNWNEELDVMATASKVALDWAAVHCNAGASVVALTSPASSRVVDEQGAAYHASKAALLALVRYYAIALAPKQIRVNAVAPSATVQDRNLAYYDAHPEYGAAVPLGRLGTPNDIAGVISFLLSDASRFITGQELTVDGGAALLHPHSLVRQAVHA